MKKNNNNEERILNIIMVMLKRIFMFKNNFLENHEYEENIGTIYKGSIKESNEEFKFRFKERFRWKHRLAFSYAKESMGR